MFVTLATAVVLAGTAPTPDQARDRADEILSRPEFQEAPKSLPERAIEWVFERVSDLLADLAGGGSGSIISWLVLAALVAIVAFVAFRVTRTLRADPAVRRQLIVGEHHRTSAEWRAEAERFEAAGSWKAALRARYRALLVDLFDRGVVRDVPGRTTGEYRREVTVRLPAVSADFAAASDLFEQAWYGDLPTGPEENTLFRTMSDHVVAGTNRADHASDREHVDMPA